MKKNAAISILWITILFSNNCLATENNQQNFETSKNLEIFNSVLREINLFYVDTINQSKLVNKAIDCMLTELDPYTIYIPEKETDDLKRMTTGEYGGIGSIIMQHEKNVVISEPYENMPAQKNDLRCGDIIISIDGESMIGKTTSYVSSKLRGVPGTKCIIEIQRKGEKNKMKKNVVREKIQMHPVNYSGIFSDSIGYIAISEFTDKAYSEFKTALEELTKKRIKSLVIDLRNNGGGIIDEAINIAGIFLPKGTEVVSTKGKTKKQEYTYKTLKEPLQPTLPLVILVNRASASASEILAGSLQDLDRATIMGERTYGKGLVQSIRNIDYKGYIKVTTAKYYTPSGRCVQAIDYQHRNEDGSVGRIPDSLTHVFHTKSGRIVRDGGGITPDSVFSTENKQVNISYYLYVQNIIFDFATEYANEHKQISKPNAFQLTDKEYEKFVSFVKDSKFTYNIQSESALRELKEVAKIEGYDSLIISEINILESKLKPNLEKDLFLFKEDIMQLLHYEIIKRYYFQKGTIQYELKNDEWLKKAIKTLQQKP